MQESTSDLLRDNCDEFIYYEDLGQPPKLAPSVTLHLPEQKKKAFELLLESLAALRRENKEVLWSSMVKDTMKRKKPSFNETYHGYRTFSELLEDAQHEGILELETDKRSRTYVVTRFGPEMHGEAPIPTGTTSSGPASIPGGAGPGEILPIPVRKKSRRRRRRGQGAVIPANGNGGPAHVGAPTPVPDFEPVEIPSPRPVVGIEVAPSPAVPARLEAPPRRQVEREPEPVPVPKPTPEPEPAPEPAAPAAPAVAEESAPAPRSRSRTSRSTRSPGTTARAPRRTGTKAGKQAETDAKEPAKEPAGE
jgi:hypothetical protein